MKTLATEGAKKEILTRIASLRSDSPRVWGKMSAPQMVCHLNDSFRVVTGEKPAQSKENVLTRTVVRWIALHVPIRWTQGTPTMPEVDQFAGGTVPGEFETDKQQLVALTEDFTSKPAYLATARHPFFGTLSEEEWMRWAYLHMDHHLRQFGC
jgi:hypothetical protein